MKLAIGARPPTLPPSAPGPAGLESIAVCVSPPPAPPCWQDLALDVVVALRIGGVGEGDLGILAADDDAGADLDARSHRYAGAGLGLAGSC